MVHYDFARSFLALVLNFADETLSATARGAFYFVDDEAFVIAGKAGPTVDFPIIEPTL
jgi:hypothetical protein